MEKILVRLVSGSYPIVIGRGLLRNPKFIWPVCSGDKVLCVTNDRIAHIYLNFLDKLLMNLGVIFECVILPDGEENKSFFSLDLIFTRLLIKNFDRSTVLFAFGGGVIGDLVGFAAAIYQRGVRFVQIPTTLLAQVDASIGGKTGVNHVLGKNMIGSFYQPISVFIDLDFLSTLSVRDFSSGLAEIIKYAVAFDVVFFCWLEKNLDALFMLKPEVLLYCVRRCCEIKASVVSKDERECRGIRSFLNLGHTYGHAIESYFCYSGWLHGEAISAGIMIAAYTALNLGVFHYIDLERIRLLLQRAHLPVSGPLEMMPEDYIKFMVRDKKSTFSKINLILPISIGNVKAFLNVNHDVIISAIRDSRNSRNFDTLV